MLWFRRVSDGQHSQKLALELLQLHGLCLKCLGVAGLQLGAATTKCPSKQSVGGTQSGPRLVPNAQRDSGPCESARRDRRQYEPCYFDLARCDYRLPLMLEDNSVRKNAAIVQTEAAVSSGEVCDVLGAMCTSKG